MRVTGRGVLEALMHLPTRASWSLSAKASCHQCFDLFRCGSCLTANSALRGSPSSGSHRPRPPWRPWLPWLPCHPWLRWFRWSQDAGDDLFVLPLVARFSSRLEAEDHSGKGESGISTHPRPRRVILPAQTIHRFS